MRLRASPALKRKIMKIEPFFIPYLTASDTKASIHFYTNAFGFIWRNENELDENGCIHHVEMTFGNLVLMFAQQGAFGSTKVPFKAMGVESPITLYLYCDDVDALYQKAITCGAEGLMNPRNEFWGDRVCLLKDPDGYEWMFATKSAS